MTSLLSARYYLHSSSTQRLGTDQGPLVLHTLHTQSPCSFLKGLLLTTHTLHHGEVTCPKPPSQQPDPKFDSWAVRAVSSKLLLQTLLPHIGSLQPPRQILSLFFSQQLGLWSDLPPWATAHVRGAAQPCSSCPDSLCRRGLALLNLNKISKSDKVINEGCTHFILWLWKVKGYTSTPPFPQKETKLVDASFSSLALHSPT